MTTAWVPLATITLDSAASSVTFSSIPQGYRDLTVVARRTVSSGSNSEKFYLNGDKTNNNYSRILMYGTGSGSGVSVAGLNSSTITISTTENITTYQLMDYSATNKHKVFLYRNDRALDPFKGTLAGAHRWSSNNAVNSIEIDAENNTYAIGSTFSLYGSNRL